MVAFPNDTKTNLQVIVGRVDAVRASNSGFFTNRNMVLTHQRNAMRTAVIAATFTTLLGMPTATLAENVQLHSYDRSLHLTGDLLSYDKTGFTIETPLGPLLVASALVTCEGAECPPLAQVHADLQASDYIVPSQASLETESLLQKPHYCPHSAIPAVFDANS